MPQKIDPGTVLAAGALAGDAANLILTGQRNKKAYKRSIEFWHMQNQYNSPEAQMRRFQKAGLNPNLIYGNGTSTMASPVPDASIETPQVNLPKHVSSYFDVQARKAQTDNLKAQNTVLLEEALLKRAQTRATLANAGLTEFKSSFEQDLAVTSAEYRKAQLDRELLGNVRTRNQEPLQTEGLKLLNDIRTGQLSLQQKSLELMKQNILNAEQRNRLNQYEETLNKSGITKSDAIYWKLLGHLLEQFGLSPFK